MSSSGFKLSDLLQGRLIAGGVTALVVGIAADLWVAEETWRLLLALIAMAVLATPPAAFAKVARRRLSKGLALALLAVASLAQSAAVDLWRFTTSPEVRVWNVYHYYLGAKYYDELGYHDLYDATLAADRQARDYWRGIGSVRNLRTYQVEPRAMAEARYRPKAHFSDARWQSFRDDVVALQRQLPARSWRNIFTDRGYNPSPFWTVMGEALAGRFEASNVFALKVLCSLDLMALSAVAWLIYRTFGAGSLALVVLFFTLSPVNNARLIGGFLQYDWFCAVAAGLCSARRGKPLAAAAFLAFATLARVFPAVLVASAALPALFAWIREGRLPRKTWIFFVAFALFCGLGVGVGCLTGHGPAAWTEFTHNLGAHNTEHRYGQRRIGLQHVFTHDVRTLELDESSGERREMFARQKGLFVASAVVLWLVYLPAVARRTLPDALLFGLIPFFTLAVSSRYYWALLALLPLLARAGPWGAARGRWLDFAQAGVFAGYATFALARPDRYAAYSVLNMLLVGFFLALCGAYLRRDLWVARRRTGVVPPWHGSVPLAVVFFAGLFLLLCFLRLPLAQHPIRDVDESVAALIAASWLDGGVPYRDAIDQRGPTTYLIFAVVFFFAGVHNMWAVHWALLMLILFVAWLLFRFGRALPGAGVASGYLAALLFAVGSYTYRRSQMLAFHTEWPMILCTTLAMLALWRGLRHGGWRRFVFAGAAYAGAFLSKQPSIFDAAAGGLFVLLWQWRRGRLVSHETAWMAAWLFAGFAAVLSLTAAYFGLAGALPDAYLYFWQYNVEHYAKVVGWEDRLRGLDPFAHSRHFLTANPLLFLGAVVSSAIAIWNLVRARRVGGRLLLTLWFLASYFGASYSGRNFGHYFIQLLPAACCLTAWFLVDAWRALAPSPTTRRWLAEFAPAGRGVLVAGALAALALPLGRFAGDIAWTNIHRDEKVDPARQRALELIAQTTAPSDTIFVWGYYPELYVLSGRRPASRYSNTNYLTGMLPWENHQPGVDTSAHIVDGAWEILLAELAASRPKLIVDTAVGNHRYYSKYPVEMFPPLADFLERNYQRGEVIGDRHGDPALATWVRR